jgi:DNA-binding transcriptional ArsR family regulator
MGRLSEGLPFTRQATRKHITQLEHAGLVTTHRVGRRVLCQARPSRLKAVHEWTTKYETFWSTALDELTQYLEFTSRMEDEQ